MSQVHPRSIISALVSIALTVSLVGVIAHTDRAAGASGCGLPNPAFCDTFDAPAGTGTRAGDLAPVWGVSRATQNTNGFGNQLQAWVPTTVDLCGTMTAAVPPADVRICNGQLREASSDGGAVTVLAAYPKQPFDFAGRTGKIVFDVSDDTEGTHGSWPELWVTDKPVPAPFQHFTHDFGAPQNAFGIRFGLECNNAAGTGVDSAVVVNNYAVNDSAFGGSLPVTIDGCVTKGVTNGGLNHFEVWVSQAQIDVYGTGPGGGALVHLATIAANLSFTKGLVWIEDVHYNAVKAREPCGCGTQKTHTFTWDNVGFDGPFTYRDLSYDVLDHLVPGDAAQDGHATVNLGWKGTSTDAVSVQTLPMAASEIAAATKAFLLFDLTVYDAPLTISYTINGHPYSAAWPFPGDTRTYLTHTTFVPVTLTDLVPGPQAITISTGTLIVVSQVNIVLVAAGSPPSPVAAPVSFHSAWSGQTAAPTLVPGTTATLTFRFQNTGTATWQRGVAGRQVNLGVSGDSTAFADLGLAVGWLSPNRPATTEEPSVAPGNIGTFTFAVRAPATPGVYRLDLRLVADGVTWLDDQGVFFTVSSDFGLHSRFSSETAWPVAQAGALVAPITIRYRNVGTRPWNRGVTGQEVLLGVVGDDPSWAPVQVGWPSATRAAVQSEASVAPGAIATFTFQLRAPSVPGIYILPLRPVVDGVTWLEDEGAFVELTVLP